MLSSVLKILNDDNIFRLLGKFFQLLRL